MRQLLDPTQNADTQLLEVADRVNVRSQKRFPCRAKSRRLRRVEPLLTLCVHAIVASAINNSDTSKASEGVAESGITALCAFHALELPITLHVYRQLDTHGHAGIQLDCVSQNEQKKEKF